MPTCNADCFDEDAGADKEDDMSQQHLAELTNHQQVMKKCMVDQLQRLNKHDNRCDTICLTVSSCIGTICITASYLA